MSIPRLESITDWSRYIVVPGVYLWGNRELGPMVDTIENVEKNAIIEVTESGE